MSLQPARRIAIVGGGISGLAAAYELAQAHPAVDFVLFEAANRLGGIVETHRSEGFTIECGPDSWVSEKPWARELSGELGLAGEIILSNDDRRRTWLLRDGQLVPMPDGMRMMVPTDLDALAASALFGASAVAAYAREPERAAELKATALALHPDADESVASFVRRHFGDEVTSTLAAPLLAGVFGGSVDSLSVRAVMPAFVKMEQEHGSLILALQRQSRQSASAPIFTSLVSGLGTLVDAIAARIPPHSVRLGTPVQALRPSTEALRSSNNGGWTVTTAAGQEKFSDVIVATPVHITRALLAGIGGAEAPRIASLLQMDATSAIIVALAFAPAEARHLRVPEGFGFLAPQTPGAEPSLLACTFIDQKFAHRTPPGGLLLRGFFGGDTAPALLEASDETLLQMAGSQLGRLFAEEGRLPTPAVALVRRLPLSLPQYAVGHLSRIAELESLTAHNLPGLSLIGNAFHGVGLPDLIREGRTTARRLLPQ